MDIKLKTMPPEHEWRGVFKVPKLKDHWENFLATITLIYIF